MSERPSAAEGCGECAKFAGMLEMTYNSVREDLVIPEYGRVVHDMVQHMLGLGDREERTRCAKAVVSVMKSVVPQEGTAEEVDRKLWGQLHMMTGFTLEVDGPYPLPERGDRETPPARMKYPSETSRPGHYGTLAKELIAKAVEMPEGEERVALTVLIANLLKRNYLTWHHGNVEDDFIYKELSVMSQGKLQVAEGTELMSTAEVLTTKRKTSDALERWKGGKKKR